MTKPVYLGQAILDLSKMVMYELPLQLQGAEVWKQFSTAVLYGHRLALYTTSRQRTFTKTLLVM